MDNPLLSIACITYNHEKFIAQAVEGFLMQKTTFPYEIVIHDDASTDKTARILEGYRSRFPNIELLFQKENQYSKGTNPFSAFVLPKCRGKYIAICEGDDYWTDPYKLQKQVDFLEANPAYVICYHDADIIDENGALVSKSKLPENLKTDFSAEELIKGAWVLTMSMCFRNVLDSFPEEYSKVKNGDKFLTSLLGNYGQGKYLRDIENAVYRKHHTSVWSSLDKVNQIFYNGDTRAWLFRYYDRIGKSRYADYFRKEVVSHFRALTHEISTEKPERYEKILNKVFSNYTDIVGSRELNGLVRFLQNKECSPVTSANCFQDAKKDPRSGLIKGDGTHTILRVGDREFIDSNGFTVDWILTRKCNYKCSYCTVHNNKTGNFVPLDKLKTIIDKLSELPNETITLALSGGEPTLHPNYFDLVEYAIEKLKDRLRVQTQTNLSKSLSFYKKFIDRFNGRLNQLSFLASYHFEFANKDRFLENIKHLSENNVDVLFKICAEPNHMDEVRRIYSESKSIVNEHLDVVLVVVRHNYGSLPDKRYTQADLDWLNCNKSEDTSITIDYIDVEDDHKIKSEMFSSNKLLISKKNRFKGMLCNAGLNSISINGVGSLDPAVCFRKTKSRKNNVYSNPESILEFKYPHVCPFETCYVPNDQRIPKYNVDLIRIDSDLDGIDKASILATELAMLRPFLKGPAIKEAELLISQKRLIEAKQILNLLSQFDPRKTNVLNNLSIISMLEKEYGETLELIKRVLAIDPQNKTAFDNLSKLRSQIKDMGNNTSRSEANKDCQISLPGNHKIINAGSDNLPIPKHLPGHEILEKEENRQALLPKLKTKNWESKFALYRDVFEYYTELRNQKSPSISVIVISWRLHPDNLKSFKILEEQRDQNFELIFVDNGAAPDEFEPLKPYIDTYVRLNTNTGAYLARNVGALFAQAPILFFLEDDGIPADNLIKAHREAFAKYDVIAVRGVYHFKNSANPFNKLAHHYYLGDLPYPRYSDLEGNASYRAENFFAVGGWDDEIIFGGGGIELAIRLMSSEPDMQKQIYSPEPVIYHDYVTDEAHLQAKRKKQNKSFARLRKKHPIFDSFQHAWNRYIGHHELIPRRMDAPKPAVADFATPKDSLLSGIYESYQSGDISQAEKIMGAYQHQMKQGI